MQGLSHSNLVRTHQQELSQTLQHQAHEHQNSVISQLLFIRATGDNLAAISTYPEDLSACPKLTFRVV